MSTNFPTSLDSFTAKIDNFDEVMAADVNNLQDAVAAVETELGTLPKGAAASVKARLENIESGWAPTGTAWAYASSTSFTVAGDVTTIYRKGVFLRWKQGAGYKYGVVAFSSYSAPNTTVNLISTDDYSVANAAITDNYFSYIANPLGWPVWFNYTPTWTATVTNPSLGDGTITSKWSVNGGLITWSGVLTAGTTTTYGSGNYYFSKPVVVGGTTRYYGQGYVRNAGIANYSFLLQVSSAETELRYFVDITAGTNNSYLTPTYPITFGSGDVIAWQIQYEI